MREARGRLAATHCPDGHLLIHLEGRLYCPDQMHDGRPVTHPQGPSESSQKFFTYEELTTMKEITA